MNFFKNLVQARRYKKLAKEVENGFAEPAFLNQTIRFVDSKEEADVYVNEAHSIGDYIVIGMISLLNSVNGESKEILVYNESTPHTEQITCIYSNRSTAETVDSGLFLQLVEPINIIYDKLYVGDCKFALVGLSASMRIMNHFAGIEGDCLPKEIAKKIKCDDFEDLQTAQKEAFILLKYLMGSSAAGVAYSIANGLD